ncbi:hypothetical protein [Mesorhizobium sp. LSHC412B00]|uniref:hypothetical protein n=1 Tax=Mesorhizobium sp. LSHC412B00 TaxID=1287285 RepID=UPI0003CDEB37|nr:hypothetical protein [Mesorhizobium sp. LSHC412B00]ESX91298.1 hypothetical protein X756_02260 [Mesorhizobium sp. LSHC412B00]
MQDVLTQKGERKRIQVTLRRLFATPSTARPFARICAGLSAVHGNRDEDDFTSFEHHPLECGDARYPI